MQDFQGLLRCRDENRDLESKKTGRGPKNIVREAEPEICGVSRKSVEQTVLELLSRLMEVHRPCSPDSSLSHKPLLVSLWAWSDDKWGLLMMLWGL